MKAEASIQLLVQTVSNFHLNLHCDFINLIVNLTGKEVNEEVLKQTMGIESNCFSCPERILILIADH